MAGPVAGVTLSEVIAASRLTDSLSASAVGFSVNFACPATLIPGGSGMRKARWAGSGRGKRGGVRVIYYFAAPDAVYFIAVYAKNEKENLSDSERKALAKILRPFKRQEH